MCAIEVPEFEYAETDGFRWPNGSQLAVWIIPNVEAFDINTAIPGVSDEVPNVPAYAVREYGNRVGFWRVKAALDEFDVPGTVALNSAVCTRYPDIAEALRDSDWEVIGHNVTNSQRLTGLGRDREAEVIQKTLNDIHAAIGTRPVGWLGAGLAESEWSLELFVEARLSFLHDWVVDDRPCVIKRSGKQLVLVPYTSQIGDKGIIERDGHSITEYVDRAKRQFDVLYREGAAQLRSMAISIHPYLIGQPHRIDGLREVLDYILSHEGVWFTTGPDIGRTYELALQ